MLGSLIHVKEAVNFGVGSMAVRIKWADARGCGATSYVVHDMYAQSVRTALAHGVL